jgi:putative DNA methylase
MSDNEFTPGQKLSRLAGNAPCFIEKAFPVSQISTESVKERKAIDNQILVALGRWKGRKPLFLVKCLLLGILLPATDDPKMDLRVFNLLTGMSDTAYLRRKYKQLKYSEIREALNKIPADVFQKYQQALYTGTTRSNLILQQQFAFKHLPLPKKLEYCQLADLTTELTKQEWAEVNDHLGTHSTSLGQLIRELSIARFDEPLIVGDAMSGGGSIPFTASALGALAIANDINPYANLLTWASLNLIGGNPKISDAIESTCQRLFDEVENKIVQHNLETNSFGWRVDTLLYCLEVTDPGSGWRIPLFKDLVINEKQRVVARLVPDVVRKRFDIEILEYATKYDMDRAKKTFTYKGTRIYMPGSTNSFSMSTVKRYIRNWEKTEFAYREQDILSERLYCVRWQNPTAPASDPTRFRRYLAAMHEDQTRELVANRLLADHFTQWSEKGYIPTIPIIPGRSTEPLTNTRGWTHWHHLFSPRQLLIFGWLNEALDKDLSEGKITKDVAVGCLLAFSKGLDYSSKLSGWLTSVGQGSPTFNNNTLNTLISYAGRSFPALEKVITKKIASIKCADHKVSSEDARKLTDFAHIWFNDPSYGDAINFDELSEFFLSWQSPFIRKIFPSWPTDSRRELSIKGCGKTFNLPFLEVLRNQTSHMPINGVQVVMFTHNDTAIWIDLSMLIWAAGLRVTAGWSILTETEGGGIRGDNGVRSTIVLVLRKRIKDQPIFQDEVIPLVEREVRKQIEQMQLLDDAEEPMYTDIDYQFAAYIAALKTLTAQPIEEVDPERVIVKGRTVGEMSLVEQIFKQAVQTATDFFIPIGIQKNHWQLLTPTERFYLKALELELTGKVRSGTYQSIANSVGAPNYHLLLSNSTGGVTRLKTPSEFAGQHLTSNDLFGKTLLRHCLYAVYQSLNYENPKYGLIHLKENLDDFETHHFVAIEIFDMIYGLAIRSSQTNWDRDGEHANYLAAQLRNL